MSPMLIAALVAGGLVLLVCIGFLSQALERARLERARKLAELQGRLRQCSNLSASLPGQFMSPELKTQLLQIEAQLLVRLVKLNSKNAQFAEQLTAVQQQLAKSEQRISNPPLAISNEAAAQSAQHQLSDLQLLLEQSRRDGILDDAAFRHWAKELNQHLYQTTLALYQSIADEAMQTGKPRVAKLQYERAIAYLSKQTHADSASQLVVFRQLLANAEQTALHMELASGNGTNELSAGVQALEKDDEAWKKKALYDD